MKKLQYIASVVLLTLSISTAAYAGTITGSRTAGTITGSRTGTITGSKTGTITGSGAERAGTITGSAPVADASVPAIGRVLEVVISLVW